MGIIERMSLRDYFAGQALSGLMASTYTHEFLNNFQNSEKEMIKAIECICKEAYTFADTMLIQSAK